MTRIKKPLEGLPAHERTLEEFIGTPEMVSEDLGAWNEEAFFLYGPKDRDYRVVGPDFFKDEVKKYWWGDAPREIYGSYSVAVLKKHPAHAILLYQPFDAASDEPLGDRGPVGEFYPDPFGNILGIAEAYRGKGVGPEFLAAAMEATGNVAPPKSYSPAGLKNRLKAHPILVRHALEKGLLVPDRVLEQYPALQGARA